MKDELEISSLVGELKKTTSQVEELLSKLKDQDYIRIGENGDVWVGDAADIAHQTFDDLIANFPSFLQTLNNYIDDVNKYI